jgi:glycine dehydrogenase
MAGLKVVPIKTHADGNLNLEDLKEKAAKHKDNLSAFMVCNQLKLNSTPLT